MIGDMIKPQSGISCPRKPDDALREYLGTLLSFLICFCVSFRPLGSGMTFGLGSNLIVHIIIFFCGILWAMRAALEGKITYRCGKIAATAAVHARRKWPALEVAGGFRRQRNA